MSECVKRRVAGVVLDGYVREGMVLGLGSGTTSEAMVRVLGERVREGLKVRGVASSHETEVLARSEGIELVPLDACGVVDVTIDGADEVALRDFSMIKGGGGCLLWEKILAKSSQRVVAIVEERKCVEFLGVYPLPIEVVPYSYMTTMRMIEQCYEARGLGEVELCVRKKKVGEAFFETDSGHYIVDVRLVSGGLGDCEVLERELNSIPGVVENGLFCGVADVVAVGEEGGGVSVYSEGGGVGFSRA